MGAGTLVGTKYGIAAASHPGVDIAALTPEAAAAIRQAGYWVPNRCDDLAAGVDLMVYDEDVNTGDGRSAKILQGCVGAVQDGVIGSATLAAANAMQPMALINALAAAQAAFYKGCAGFAEDGAGWLARLTARQGLALEMAGE